MTIPFMDLKRQYTSLMPRIQQAIGRVFDRSFFILGTEGKAFEKEFSAYVGVQHGIGVNSGTDALFLALLAAGIGKGDEVITVANTAIPTVAAIVATGAIPRFVDIDEKTALIDCDKITAVITSKTRAIIPVHLYGNPVPMKRVMEIASNHNLTVIEDCAQAHGACINGQRVGSFGHLSCFSFYPTKNLGAYGDAGMILTSHDDLAKKLTLLRQYGEEKRYHTIISGFNSRLDELQAAILLVKLKYLDQWNKKRKEIVEEYKRSIQNTKIQFIDETQEGISVHHLFVVRTPDREEFQQYLQNHGIGTAIHYPIPLHLQKAYTYLGYKEGYFPATEKVMSEIVSLPLFPELTKQEVDYVITTINNY
jgi:dTDP-4-amino-4,6-dideoxygalactose transaminase